MWIFGTWWCITPFIGAGVGGARVAINGFTNQSIALNGGVDPGMPGLAFGDDVSEVECCWAVHAGLAYEVTPNFTVELAYRYYRHGRRPDGRPCALDEHRQLRRIRSAFQNITSHDLKLGVRWDLTSPQVYAPPPLMRKGHPVPFVTVVERRISAPLLWRMRCGCSADKNVRRLSDRSSPIRCRERLVQVNRRWSAQVRVC